MAGPAQSSLCSWVSSVSATTVFTASAASLTTLATFSTTLWLADDAGLSVADLVTIDSGLGTP